MRCDHELIVLDPPRVVQEGKTKIHSFNSLEIADCSRAGEAFFDTFKSNLLH
jgi:hypothetical protein